MLKFKPTKALLIASLVTSLSGCIDQGLFCDVVTSPINFESATALQVVKTDRVQDEKIAVQNEYGRRNCKWSD